MVGVGVGFEDPSDFVAVGGNEGEKGVGGGGGDGVVERGVVEDGVDDGGCLGEGVGDEVLEGGGSGFEEGGYCWFWW